MYQDSSEQAARYLREAVPLMVKYRIPPTPYNYALWYSYVSNRDPKLKTAIDSTLASHGTCPTSASEALFRDHIIADQLAEGQDLQHNLKAILSELRTQVDGALEGAEDFHQLLESSSHSLEKNPDQLDLMGLISTLAQGTQQVSDSNRVFRNWMAETQKEMEQLREALKSSKLEAERDPLTGLHNRRSFERHMDELMRSGGCEGRCLVLVDIDHFKSFNDSYGHQVGDKVIKRVATLLQDALTGNELAVRFGGEEFLLLLDQSDSVEATARAEAMRTLLETIVLKDRRAGRDVRRITASFGIAACGDSESLGDWLERADKALYRAKDQGRNRVISAE